MSERWRFRHPFTARFVGPTSCGKTTFLRRVLDQKLIDPFPTRIIYFHGSKWQTGVFDHLKNEHQVTFIQGFDESAIRSEADSEPMLIICDDLILEMKDSEAAANLFMRGSHHLNMSVILVEQSLFPKGRQSVSMKQNAHYTVLFKSPADALGVATLARQMFPSKGGKFLVDAFHDCTQQPFSYLIIDTKQATPDEARLVSRIDDPSLHPVVYVSSSMSSSDNIHRFNSQDVKDDNQREEGEEGEIQAEKIVPESSS